MLMQDVVLAPEALAVRHLRASDYVPDTEAFVDCRLPGSMPKENYSMIGPGVTQSAKQFINLQEPHGFNVGAAGVHPGITNNLHLHFTSETFVAASGAYTLRWGVRGDEGSLHLDTGDIVVMPTWMFRGFSSASDEYGFLMTVLGGDDTGGIIWSPDVLQRARGTGLWLTRENLLVDTSSGASPPPEEECMPLLGDLDVKQLRHWQPEEMAERVLRKQDRDFRSATLDTSAGARWQLAPAVGYGVTQRRDHWPRVGEPQGFSIEWAKLEPGDSSAVFRTTEKMVLISVFGRLRVRLNRAPNTLECVLGPRDILSIPSGVWRQFINEDSELVAAETLIVLPGDARKKIDWESGIRDAAAVNGVTLDADGRMAPSRLLPPGMRLA